jgi:zinc transporter
MIKVDDPCYVFGFALDGNGGGIAAEAATGQPTWLHIDYSHSSSMAWLRALGVGEGIIEALTRADTRPRTAHFDDGILLVLRGINMNPGSDPEDMVSLRMWIQRDRLITVRQRKLMAAQDIKDALEAGQGPHSIAELVSRLVERLADRVASFVDQLEDKLTEIEAKIESHAELTMRPEISAIRRQTATVRRYLAPQREALDSFYRLAENALDESAANDIREQSDRITRAVEDIDLVKERALVLQEELLNMVMQEQSDRMYALSIIAAIFLPITFITGMFGMNVAGLPGLEEPNAFIMVAVSMILLSGGVIYWLRMKRWL